MVHVFIWMSEFTKSQYKAAAMTGNYKRTQSQVNTPSPCVSRVSYVVRPLPQCQLEYLMFAVNFIFPTWWIIYWLLVIPRVSLQQHPGLDFTSNFSKTFQMDSDETLMLPSELYALWKLPFFILSKFTFWLMCT